MGASPAIVRARGPLAVESALLAELREEIASLRSDPRRLAAPLSIAVPSDGLRLHVTALLARQLGAVAGVRVETLASLAHDTIARAGETPLQGGSAAAILVLREARAALRPEGEAFAAAAAASITDLLDSGFTPELEQAVLETVLDSAESASISALEQRIVGALVRGAVRAREACDAHGVARPADVYARAAAVLRAAARTGGPRAVWLYGFSDATGLQGDCIEALAARIPVRVFWDDAALAPRFGAALRARLGIEPPAARDHTVLVPAHFRARGVEAEVREVLRRARRLLDSGVAPERIAIVARAPEPYGSALRTHAARLAIPISAEGVPGPLGARGRLDLARLEILREARRVPVERWLAASLVRRSDELALLTGLRVAGAARLGAVADLDLERVLGDQPTLKLPFLVARASDTQAAREQEDEREGSDESDSDSDVAALERPEDSDVESARTLPRSSLVGAIDAARALLADLDAWPASASCREHARHLGLVLRRLGSGPDDAVARSAALLCADVPAQISIDRLEFLDALAPAVEASAREPLGGRGGGILCASVALARGRAFEHLFVLGLNAGVFPAAAREDPLFGDDIRRLAQACLADLPLKRARSEEESATFAQLLAGGAHVTLSWLVADADDLVLAPSPLLDAAGIDKPEAVETSRGALEAAEGVPQPVHEHALLAARAGGHAGLAEVLELAISAGRSANGLDTASAARTAAARLGALAELDRRPGPPEALGAFFGSTGPAAAQIRGRNELPVTTLEGLGRCPWQAFLTRVLRVQAPLDPLVGAPRLDARVIGTVAHALIAGTARRSHVSLEVAEEEDGQVAAWPTPERLRAQALDLAARTLRAEGLYAPGLDALVAARALELAAVARRLDEADASLRVLAAEVTGWIPIAKERKLTFRADRVERSQGRLRLTDWKSGHVFGSEVATEATRAKHSRIRLRRGTHLQAFVYAVAGGAGRYVALKPDFRDDAHRAYPVFFDDEEAGKIFAGTRDTLLSAWDEGAFFPRLVEHAGRTENPACASCEVAAACVRGDSGARKRFGAFVRRVPTPEEQRVEGALGGLVRRVFAMHAPEPKTTSVKAQSESKPEKSKKPRSRKADAEDPA